MYVAICRCGNAYIIRRTNRSQTLNSTQYSKHPAAPSVVGEACRARRASLTNSKRFPRCIVVTTKKNTKKNTPHNHWQSTDICFAFLLSINPSAFFQQRDIYFPIVLICLQLLSVDKCYTKWLLSSMSEKFRFLSEF